METYNLADTLIFKSFHVVTERYSQNSKFKKLQNPIPHTYPQKKKKDKL